MEDSVLGARKKCEAGRLLAQIRGADSMIVAVKAGATAEGFVRGLEIAGALIAGDAENLYLVFESALQQRLKILIA